MKINFKKIVALGTSVLMTVSGIGFAAAANYPAPFVSGGVANVAIVFGTGNGVSALDLVEASNIQSNLQSFMTGTSGGTSSTISGQGVIIKKSSDNFNLGDKFDDLQTTLDYEDLPTLLAKGTYIAGDHDEYKYEQKITLGKAKLTHFRDSDYESDIKLSTETPIVGFKINSSEFVLNYTIDFTTDAESDIVSSELDDIEGSDLPLFGKIYYVSDFDTTGGATGFLGKLTLLDSAEVGSVSEGEATTIAGHEVSISWIDNNEVVFTVDGERAPASGKLVKGDSYKLTGGSYLGVRDISKLEVSGEVGKASFSIGTGKVEILSGSEIELNDVSIDGVKGWIHNSTSGTSAIAKLDKIEIEWKADEEQFLTSKSELTMPGFGGVKFTMNEIVRNPEEKITVQKNDDSNMKVTMPLKDGEVSFYILYANTTGDFVGIGKSATERVATSNNKSLKFYEKLSGADYHKYFIASYNTTTEAESYLLEAKIAYSATNLRDEVDIKKITPSGSVEVCPDKTNGAECTIGSVTLTVLNVSDEAAGNESVILTAGSKVSFHTAFTAGGVMMYLPYTNHSGGGGDAGAILVNGTIADGLLNSIWDISTAGQGYDTYYLNFDAEDKDDTIAAGTAFNLTIDDSSNKLQVTEISGTGSGGAHGLQVGSSSSIYEAHLGGDVDPRILHYTKSDNDDYAEVYYPSGNSESYAEVYVAEVGATITPGTGATGGTTSLGEVLVKDSEVSSVSTKNLIVVGGSCINSAAANLVGGAKCGADFTTATGVGSGQYLIKSYDGKYTTGKIALLVAGYDVADTVNAAKYLRTQTVDTSKAYKGTTATTAEVVTTTA